MGILLYNLTTRLYFFAIRLAALWNEKARHWYQGRVGVFERLEAISEAQMIDKQRLVWMHCASLGEFEQGRPVLEALRRQYPEWRILLTFFSPSGYEIRKNYPIADWVAYLPSDTAANANRFMETVRPDLAIFVKYEFWYHYLAKLQAQQIPTLLISAIFRPTQPFFKWYGGLHRQMLGAFRIIFVQDQGSQSLLSNFGFNEVEVVGDTRVDRVIEIAAKPLELPLVKGFCGDAPVLVCGSTWPADEAILNQIFSNPIFNEWRFILAPHDVQSAHLQAIESKLPVSFVRYSNWREEIAPQTRLLLIDNIGLLSSLYQFARIAYIGGGFGQGIHNTLEPAAFGVPVVFGPKYKKFEEAKWMVEHGGGFQVTNAADLTTILLQLSENQAYNTSASMVKQFINDKSGGTNKVVETVGSIFSQSVNDTC